jgi:glycosyltransferase involved in cell wall biosynthesis
VIRQYAIHPEKIQIVPWAPPTTQYVPVSADQVEEARHRLGLPETYALYPAVTWPHKNHLRLLEALATLRDSRGLIVNLVCTGARGPSWSRVEQQVQELNLSSQVRFCGFLSETDLLAVYRLAQFLILPSLFEADSCPIYEAWSEGIPVASSNHTALPDQVADAGLLFDAGDTTAIAETVERMATDDKMRRQLVERGYRRVRDFDWDRTAKAYRAVYRRASGATLTEEDRWLLEWDWMRDPDRTPGIGLIQ